MGKGKMTLAKEQAARQITGVWRERAERVAVESVGPLLRRMDALRQEAERTRRRLEETRAAAASTGQALSPLGGGRRHKQSKVEACVIKSVELEEDLKELEEKLEPLVERARGMIGGMEAGTRRTVVRLRFLEGASCAMIAWRLHYSRSYVYKALGEGMAEMAKQEG